MKGLTQSVISVAADCRIGFQVKTILTTYARVKLLCPFPDVIFQRSPLTSSVQLNLIIK